VAQPVAQRDEPAERPDVGRRERHHRVVGAEERRGQVEHHVVRPDRDDGARDLVKPAQQVDGHARPGVMPLRAGRHDEQPVGADQ